MEYFNHYYLYILIIIISSNVSDLIYGINHNETFATVRISSEDFSKHYLIHELWNYFGTLIISLCLSIYENNKLSDKTNRQEKKGWIKLIYNNSNNNNYDITSRFVILYFLKIWIWVFVDQIIEYSIFLMIFQDLDFWMLELFFLSYLNKIMSYRIKIYRHQELAMYLSIIPSLLKVGSIVLSFCDETYDKNNYNGNLPIYYTKYPELIAFGIILYFVLILLRSYVNLSIKWFMDIKYVSHFKILTVFGFWGTFFYFIICLISSFVDCGDYEFCKYLAKVQVQQNNTTNRYFDNFKVYSQNFNGSKKIIREILVIFFGIASFFFNKLGSLLVIKYLTPVHVIFSMPFKYLLQKIVSFSCSLLKSNRKYISTDEYKIYKLILDTLGDVISSIVFLIYLELIVFKCFNYDYDIKNNIIKRSFADAKEINDDNESSNYNEITDDNLEIKEIVEEEN